LWAQIFPFVALLFFDGEETARNALTTVLVGCFGLWLVLNIIFFCTIDLKFLNTFFGTKTAPKYTCELFETSEEDYQRWDAVFENRIDYTKSIHDDVRDWVARNIDRWKEQKPDWFKIEIIPDTFLPSDVFEEEGGARRRRRSSVSIREIVGITPAEPTNNNNEQEIIISPNSVVSRWTTLAEELYNTKTNNRKSNFAQLKKAFNSIKELLNPLTTRCPDFRTILAYALADSFGFRVQKINEATTMNEWTMEDCRKVGNSLATFIKKRKTGTSAIKAWQKHYKQLDVLFSEVEGELAKRHDASDASTSGGVK